MKYQVVLDTVEDVIYEGNRSECEVIIKAFTQYNDAKNIVLREIEVPTLTDKVRDKIQNYMVEVMIEVNRDDSGCIRDMLNFGVKGYDDYTDEELLDEYEGFPSCDEDLLAEARATLVIQEVLS